MKLDPRIIEGRKPLTCFDAEEAEKFVGQKGYVSDDISTFTDLDFCESGGNWNTLSKKTEMVSAILIPWLLITTEKNTLSFCRRRRL